MTQRRHVLLAAPRYDCLSQDSAWFARYIIGWLALGLFAMVAFLLVTGHLAVWAQALCFLMLFAQTLRPIVAARTVSQSRYAEKAN